MKNLTFNRCILILLILSTQVSAELSYSVQRRVDVVSNKLSQVELLVEKDLSQAKTTMAEAQQEFDYINEYYSGKYDENDAQIQIIKSKLKSAGERLMGSNLDKVNDVSIKGVDETISSQSRLGDIKSVLTDYDKKYMSLYKQLQNDLLSLSSNLQTSNNQKINDTIINVTESIDQFNALYFPLNQLLTNVKNKYPDLQKLMTQGQTGADTSLLIRNLTAEVVSWNKQRKKLTQKWLGEANEAISQTEIVMMQVKQMPANTRAPMVGQFIELLKTPQNLISIIPALYPQQDHDVTERKKYLSLSEGLAKKFNKTKNTIINIAQSAKTEIEKQLQANRFPKGLDANHADKSTLVAAYNKVYKTEIILRFGVSKDWYEKTEAHWVNDVLVVGTYKYIHAWVAHKTQSGVIRAYSTTYRQTRESNGSWSQLIYWGVGNSFEILEKNLNL